jgi:Ser/Thr protein kinase RdoA (MazF antagonist)
MASSSDLNAALPQGDAQAVDEWLDRLNVRLSCTSTASLLAGGQSKAAVYLVARGWERYVLKVTTSDRWRSQAIRELQFYQDVAPSCPLPVPALLASTVVQEGICLLMSAHGQRVCATDWSKDQWIYAAAQAGELHRHGQSLEPPDLVRRVNQPDPEAIGQAATAWIKLGHPEIADYLPSLLVEVTRALIQAPMTLIHGDCHVDNLLIHDGGELVWVDWQEVSAGAGPEDLALLWQRAEFDGARPPRAAMTAAYIAGLGTMLDGSVEQLMLAAELRLLLLEWPHFLPHGDSQQQQTMLRRLHKARQEWVN